MVNITRFGPFEHDLKAQGGLAKDQIHGTWYGPDERFAGGTTVVATAHPMQTSGGDRYVTVRDVLVKTHTHRDGDILLQNTEIGINVVNLGDDPLSGYTLYFDVIRS